MESAGVLAWGSAVQLSELQWPVFIEADSTHKAQADGREALAPALGGLWVWEGTAEAGRHQG